jgi:hypothetical protein
MKIGKAIGSNSFFEITGELAQLVERFHGMEEAIGSNPLFSTKRLSQMRQPLFI